MEGVNDMFAVNEIMFDDKKEAEKVMKCAKDILNVYGCVSLADIYDLSLIDASFEDTKKIWTNLDEMKLVCHPYDGYWTIVLPN